MGTCHGPQQPPPEGGHLTSSPNLTMSWDPKVQGTGLPTNLLKVGKNLGKWTRNNFLGGTFRAGGGGTSPRHFTCTCPTLCPHIQASMQAVSTFHRQETGQRGPLPYPRHTHRKSWAINPEMSRPGAMRTPQTHGIYRYMSNI